MPSNDVIIAAAGSRKTSILVEEALKVPQLKVLILTYTLDNLKQIREYIIRHAGLVPQNIFINSWFSFLLTDTVRPYQNYVYDKKRIKTLFFIQGKSTQWVMRANTEKYYFAGGDKVYTDKISEFACLVNEKSNGKIISRLEQIYDSVFIDEVQDLAGYDFDFLSLLFGSNIKTFVVGDCRQATYFTNCSPKNAKYKGKNIYDLFRDWEKEGHCTITERNECYRCNQEICDFADALYPDLPKTDSKNNGSTGHDGIFVISKEQVDEYVRQYNPKILRDTKRSDTLNYSASNFGISKGQTFDRVLIFPNGPMKRYLVDKNASNLKDNTRSKFYVALTRARYSVTIVCDNLDKVNGLKTVQLSIE